ncbi:MAG: NAD-dependent epimerase/dehydratase family protein [Pseudoxanthomonas sp.]
MRALVIGGNGFLGCNLVDALRGRVDHIRVLDRYAPRLDFDWVGVEYTIGAFGDEDTLRSALAGIDIVYHLASTTVPSTSNADPQGDVASNLIGALRLVAAMRASGLRRLVFFSSGGTVYGDPFRLPVDEAHPLNPISSYGVVKVAIESYLRMYQQLGELDPMIIRPSNPYGPRQAASGVQGAVAAFLEKARDHGTVAIWGDGETVRDYLYVDDLTALAVEAGLSGLTGVVNAGSGEGYSLNQLCDVIRQQTGAPLPVEYLPARSFDVRNVVLDIGAARKRFGWTPRISLADGIARTWAAMQPLKR